MGAMGFNSLQNISPQQHLCRAQPCVVSRIVRCQAGGRLSRPAAARQQPLQRRAQRGVRCQAGDKPPAGGKEDLGVRRADMDKALEAMGVDRTTARKVLLQWQRSGVDNADKLRAQLVKRTLSQSTGIAIQFTLDLGSAAAAFYTGKAFSLGQTFGSATIAVEYLVYTLGAYLLISAALDLFSLVSVLQASSRYSTNADAFLAAVEALAGPDSATGLAVVDKAVKAVNVRRVIAALDKILEGLKSTPGAPTGVDFLRDLASYLTLERAERMWGFDPAVYDLDDAAASAIADVFSLYDVNDDGQIDDSEFRALCAEKAPGLEAEEVEAARRMLDTDASGAIDFREWVEVR